MKKKKKRASNFAVTIVTAVVFLIILLRVKYKERSLVKNVSVSLHNQPSSSATISESLLMTNNSNEGEEETLQQQKEPTLWLIVCETRSDSTQLNEWTKGAHRFQRQQNQNNNSSYQVQIRNICEGKEWNNYMATKIQTLNDFLSTDQTSPNDMVMVTDTDTVINAFAIDLSELLQRFDSVTTLFTKERIPQIIKAKIVVSAEPICWIGRPCTSSDIKSYYPAATNRSSCPQFINAGQYMGYASAIQQMTTTMLLGWKKSRGRGKDDQFFLTKYYANQQQAPRFAENNPKIVLDVDASIFRTMTFGIVNSKESRPPGEGRTCGSQAIAVCGSFSNPTLHAPIVTPHTKTFEMPHVRGCPNAEKQPFSIHFPGGSTKSSFVKLVQDMNQATVDDQSEGNGIRWRTKIQSR